jgi:hypothetical protein
MLIIDRKPVPTNGYVSLNWNDDSAFRMNIPQDGAPRGNQRVNMVGIHTTEGKRAVFRPGRKAHHNGAQQYIKSWQRSAREAAAHMLIGWDAIVYQIADLQTEMAYHIGGLNRVSIGIEIVQIENIIYLDQLVTLVQLCKDLSEYCGIQPMIHLPYKGGPVARIREGKFFGFFGHRDQTDDRGYGDPNDEPLIYLRDAGFEAFDVSKGEDVTAWKQRQTALGVTPDGVPGRGTFEALKAAGYKKGIWAYGR